MRNYLLYVFCAFVCMFVVSCHGSELKDFKSSVVKIFPDIERDSVDYIIIPNQGCGGCITYAEGFYDDHKFAGNIRYIFTNIVSIKMLKAKLEINKNNTHLDSDNEIIKSLPPNAKIYPSVIVMKYGDPISIYYQSPYEDGLLMIDETKLK